MTMKKHIATIARLSALALTVGCGSDDPSPRDRALTDVKALIARNLDDLVSASVDLQTAAPAPDDDGWSAPSDASALDAMKAAWKKARVAYEHVEGAIAVLFPELDVATDQRYDGFLATYGPDANPFDGQGVTGVHAIERIVWSDNIDPRVLTFERALPGYGVARFPAIRQEADDFKSALCGRLIADVRAMRDDFRPLALDPAAAFRGIVGSMEEQLEKAEKAATGEEESRYARFTLADMRANVEGGRSTFEAFRPWLTSVGGAERAASIDAAFARIDTAYAGLGGEAIPAVPATWSSLAPSAQDLSTSFGQLWTVLRQEADPDVPSSLVAELSGAAVTMGIPELP
jgi:iron uptake system component EfeO